MKQGLIIQKLQQWRQQVYQGKNYTGAPGDFAPEMQKKSPRK